MAGAVPAKTANVTAPQIRFFIASPFQLCSFKVTARNKRIDAKLEVRPQALNLTGVIAI